MEKVVQNSLLDDVKELPLSRSIFGYRLEPIRILKPSEGDFCFIWKVCFTSIDGVLFSAFFNRLCLAESFVRKYKVNHTSKFWNRVLSDRIYSYFFAHKSFTKGDNWL